MAAGNYAKEPGCARVFAIMHLSLLLSSSPPSTFTVFGGGAFLIFASLPALSLFDLWLWANWNLFLHFQSFFPTPPPHTEYSMIMIVRWNCCWWMLNGGYFSCRISNSTRLQRSLIVNWDFNYLVASISRLQPAYSRTTFAYMAVTVYPNMEITW